MSQRISGCHTPGGDVGGARGGSARQYEFDDRALDGYTGRWRYRVRERDVGTLYGRVTFSILFKRRADAATFAGQCETFGAEGAARWLDSCGSRHSEDFKAEEPR